MKSTDVTPIGDSRYPSLRFISVLLKIVAILPIFGAIIAALVGGSKAGGVIVASSILGSFIWLVMLWAASESIQIFIDMEENQRKIIILINKAKTDSQ